MAKAPPNWRKGDRVVYTGYKEHLIGKAGTIVAPPYRCGGKPYVTVLFDSPKWKLGIGCFNLEKEPPVDLKQKLQSLEDEQRRVAAEMVAVRAEIEAEEKAKRQVGLKTPTDAPTLYYATGFGSSNQKQAAAFQEAVKVMAELRQQPGVMAYCADPHVSKWRIRVNLNCRPGHSVGVEISTCVASPLGPDFESENAALNAVNAVGANRILAAAKTLVFDTPESRGEV